MMDGGLVHTRDEQSKQRSNLGRTVVTNTNQLCLCYDVYINIEVIVSDEGIIDRSTINS